jgi:hypothetical protein
LIGVFIFFMLGLIGGSREAQNATDSGNLNLAKQAILHPTITLNTGTETDNYGGLADANGNISLLSYNRLMGQTLIVAANAETEGTTAAKTNYQALMDTFQSGSSSISQRLHDSLSSASLTDSNFSGLSLSNSTRMVKNASVNPVDASYQTAYIDSVSPTNVSLDPTILPTDPITQTTIALPSNALSTTVGSDGNCYLNGYLDMAFGQLPSVSGAAVHPGQQPHLISQTTFAGAKNNPVTAGAVPPNSFQSVASTNPGSNVIDSRPVGTNPIVSTSSATVGALTTDYHACITRGYIVVYNPSGFGSSQSLTAVEDLRGLAMASASGNVAGPTSYSGIGIFNHKAVYPTSDGVAITKPGTVLQLLTQCGDLTILAQIKQRIREIKPSATDTEMTTLLGQNQIGLGQFWYIYMDQSSGSLMMTQTEPSWLTGMAEGWQNGNNADGHAVQVASIFQTSGYSVNPTVQASSNNVLDAQTIAFSAGLSNIRDLLAILCPTWVPPVPPPSPPTPPPPTPATPTTPSLASDMASWTSSSGYCNLLGTLVFQENITTANAPLPTPATAPDVPPSSSSTPSTPPASSSGQPTTTTDQGTPTTPSGQGGPYAAGGGGNP